MLLFRYIRHVPTLVGAFVLAASSVLEWAFLIYPLDQILPLIQVLLISYNVIEAYTDQPIQHHNLIKLSSSGTPTLSLILLIFSFF